MLNKSEPTGSYGIEECAKSSLPTLHLPSSVPAWLLLLKGVQQSHSQCRSEFKNTYLHDANSWIFEMI